MSLAQGNNTPTRPRIEPGSPDPESDALTIRPVRPPREKAKRQTKKETDKQYVTVSLLHSTTCHYQALYQISRS